MDLTPERAKQRRYPPGGRRTFFPFGADKVSVNDIARKAGVSQATIYNNFGSKEELVHDYRKSIVSGIASRFREILVWKKSFIEKFEGIYLFNIYSSSTKNNSPVSGPSSNSHNTNLTPPSNNKVSLLYFRTRILQSNSPIQLIIQTIQYESGIYFCIRVRSETKHLVDIFGPSWRIS